MIDALARYVITGFICLLIGIGGTLALTGNQATKDALKTASTELTQSAQGNLAAVQESAVIEKKLDVQNASADTVKQEIRHDLSPTKIVYVRVVVPGITEEQLCPPVSGDSVLPFSVHSVRLLNDLRAAKTVDLTGLTADQIQASADVTVAEFVDNDTDVVKLYNELALRHDGLVDAVIVYMKDQASGK